MEWLPVIIVVSGLAFAGAYGIQKRKRWAWHAGWMFSFFVAGGVAYFGMGLFFNAQNFEQIFTGIVFTFGGACLWTFWAVWWATHRRMFSRRQKSPLPPRQI